MCSSSSINEQNYLFIAMLTMYEGEIYTKLVLSYFLNDVKYFTYFS